MVFYAASLRWVTISFLISAATSTASPDFSTVFERCPASYFEGNQPNNWTTYHSVDRLSWCNKTQLLDFSLYNTLDEEETLISIRTTVDVQASSTERHFDNSTFAKCGRGIKESIALEKAVTSSSRPRNATLDRYVAAAADQLHHFLGAQEHCGANISVAYAISGSVVVGALVGGLIENDAASDILVQSLRDHVATDGIRGSVLLQYCGNHTKHSMGVIASVGDSALQDVQRTLRD
jgi:chitinase